MAIENAPEEFQEDLEQEELESTEEIESGTEEESSEEQIQYVEEYNPDEPTDEQKQALSMGWRPEGVEGKRAVTAAEFIDRKPFFDKIHKQNKELKELREAFDEQREMDRKARKIQIEKLEQKLRAERKQAIEDQDGERFDEIDEELDGLKTEKAELDKEPEIDEEALKKEAVHNYQNWLQDNNWYKEDFEMAQSADAYGKWYAQNNPDGYTPEEFYGAITTHVQKKFPEYFSGTKRTKPAAVSKSTRGTDKVKSKYKVSDLPEGGERTMRKMINLGLFTDEAEYLNDFFGNQ